MSGAVEADSVSETGDRAWSRHVGAVDQALVRQWRRAADHGYAQDRERFVGGSAPAFDRGISVVIPTYRGIDRIERCLQSLAAQTIDPALFEVIVVLNGPPDGTDQIVTDFRKAHEHVNVRTIRLNGSGASRARNAGVAAARRRYTTFVDDDDYVSKAYLEVLLAYAGPRVVPIVPVIDVCDGKEITDNYINVRLKRHIGSVTAPMDIPVATSFNAAKAVATDLLQAVPYDVELSSSEDVLLWTALAVRKQVEFLPCPDDLGASYYRVVRPGSLSRPAPDVASLVRPRLEVISRVEALLKEADAGTAELVRDRMRQLAHPIGQFVRDRPESHEAVVSALDQHRIFQFPYGVLNAGQARGLLVAYAFPPYADTSAIVAAKRVRARGEVVDVIANAMDRIRAVDETTRRISGPFVDREARIRTPSYFASWDSMAAFAREGHGAVRRLLDAKGGYAWLYSRAHFAASHLLAATVKLARPELPWTAEFSDPLSRDVLGGRRAAPLGTSMVSDLRRSLRRQGLSLPASDNAFVMLEELTYLLADELVFTNINQLEYMLSYCTDQDLAAEARRKAIIQPQPTLPDAFYSMVECDQAYDDGLVHVGYFGAFYPNRGPNDLLCALQLAGDRMASRMRVHVYTSRTEEVRREAALLGVSGSVVVSPYVSYLEFLHLTTRMDCLVVADAVTGLGERNPFLPSKLADYRGSGTPIWGIVEPGSPLSKEPLNYRTPAGNHSEGAEVICEIVQRTAR